MLYDNTRFKQYLEVSKTKLVELADIPPKRSVSYYSDLAKGKIDPSTKARYELMHKTDGYVMPWHWYNFDMIPTKYIQINAPITLKTKCSQ